MIKRDVYCRFCRKRMGEDKFYTSQEELDNSKSPENPEGAVESDQLSSFQKKLTEEVEVERTQKLGIIVRIPCPHCEEDNYFRMYESEG